MGQGVTGRGGASPHALHRRGRFTCGDLPCMRLFETRTYPGPGKGVLAKPGEACGKEQLPLTSCMQLPPPVMYGRRMAPGQPPPPRPPTHTLRPQDLPSHLRRRR